ncbi:unnamed protein product [Closterium sp. NIES-64]|nr:unnamed protein product [Closterium sp. NIES-64]
MDVWGPARVRGQEPVSSSASVSTRTFLVLRLHSDRGGEFSSDLLAAYCAEHGIEQSFTLPASPHQNGVAERRIGLVMEVARTSLIHAAAPHFLWPFAVRYAAHQLNLWPRVSLPETSPTLLWTGEVGDASLLPRHLALSLAPQDVTFDESVPYYRLFPYPLPRSPPPPPASLLAPGAAVLSTLVLLAGTEPGGAEPGGAEPGGAEPGGAEPGGAEPGGAEPGGAELGGTEPGGAEPVGAEPGGAELQSPECTTGTGASASPPSRELPSRERIREWYEQRCTLRSGAPRVADPAAAGAADPGVRAAAGAEDPGVGAAAGAEDPDAGAAAGAEDPGVGAAAGAEDPDAGAATGTRALELRLVLRTRTLVLLLVLRDPGVGAAAGAEDPKVGAAAVAEDPAAAAATVCLLSPWSYSFTLVPLEVLLSVVSLSLVLRRLSLVVRRLSVQLSLVVVSPRQLLPAVPRHSPDGASSLHCLHSVCPSAVSSCVLLFLLLLTRGSNSLRAASPTVTRLLATVVTDPSFESAAASALVAELVDFAATCRLDYAASLVAEFEHPDPTLLRRGDGTGPYSSQWQSAMDTEMASWKSTGTYVHEVPPPGANIVSGMWIFRVKRPPGSPPVFKARYVARGFSQREGVDFFQTFSPTPKMTTLRVLLHVAAQRDYELHYLHFSTAFPAGQPARGDLVAPPTLASLGRSLLVPSGASDGQSTVSARPPREWHDTLRTTLAALGFAPFYS